MLEGSNMNLKGEMVESGLLMFSKIGTTHFACLFSLNYQLIISLDNFY
jgi:hypothetical protein